MPGFQRAAASERWVAHLAVITVQLVFFCGGPATMSHVASDPASRRGCQIVFRHNSHHKLQTYETVNNPCRSGQVWQSQKLIARSCHCCRWTRSCRCWGMWFCNLDAGLPDVSVIYYVRLEWRWPFPIQYCRVCKITYSSPILAILLSCDILIENALFFIAWMSSCIHKYDKDWTDHVAAFHVTSLDLS